MSQGNNRQNGVEKLRHQLAKAQSDLERAQEKRVRAMAKGEREVEKARHRADTRVAKATERVERRATRISNLENRLTLLQSAAAGSAAQPEILTASSDGTVRDTETPDVVLPEPHSGNGGTNS